MQRRISLFILNIRVRSRAEQNLQQPWNILQIPLTNLPENFPFTIKQRCNVQRRRSLTIPGIGQAYILQQEKVHDLQRLLQRATLRRADHGTVQSGHVPVSPVSGVRGGTEQQSDNLGISPPDGYEQGRPPAPTFLFKVLSFLNRSLDLRNVSALDQGKKVILDNSSKGRRRQARPQKKRQRKKQAPRIKYPLQAFPPSVFLSYVIPRFGKNKKSAKQPSSLNISIHRGRPLRARLKEFVVCPGLRVAPD